MKAQSQYESKREASKSKEKSLFTLAWEVNDVEELIQLGQKLAVEIKLTIERLMDKECNVVIENIAKKITSLRNELTLIIKNLSKHQREAASHIFVLMISSECRN